LQVGAFSFQVHLPAVSEPPPRAPRPANEEELVATPSGVGDSQGQSRSDAWLEQRQEELDRQEDNLRILQQDCGDRLGQLKQMEKEVAASLASLEEERLALRKQQAALDHARATLQVRTEEIEVELERRQAEAEARMKAEWEQFEARRRQAEQDHLQALAAP